MPPESTITDITLEEAQSMFKYPLTIEGTIQLKIGPYGWYVSDGTQNTSLGSKRKPPTVEEALVAFKKTPSSSIVKKISNEWSLRKRQFTLSYVSETIKANKSKPKFYPVSNISGKWNVKRCEEFQK